MQMRWVVCRRKRSAFRPGADACRCSKASLAHGSRLSNLHTVVRWSLPTFNWRWTWRRHVVRWRIVVPDTSFGSRLLGSRLLGGTLSLSPRHLGRRSVAPVLGFLPLAITAGSQRNKFGDLTRANRDTFREW